MFRPQVTFSRKGITSSGPSGPPKDSRSNASYDVIPPSTQPSAGARSLVTRGVRPGQVENLLDVPVGVVVVPDRLVELLTAATCTVRAQVLGRARDGVEGVHDVGRAVAVPVDAVG